MPPRNRAQGRSNKHDMHVALEPVNQPEIIALIGELDAYQSALYPSESNHFLDLTGLMQANVLFAVARDGDRAALGCGAIMLLDGYAELKRMYVAPGARGRGIAKRLLEVLEEEALNSSRTVLRLETGIHQPEALGLYERAGYVRRDAYGDYQHDPLSVYMEKRVVR